jgi:hypothetical protein
MEKDAEDNRKYKVVVNHEEQYSIWVADRVNPAGLARRSNARVKVGMPRLYQRSLDRYETTQSAKTNGRARKSTCRI